MCRVPLLEPRSFSGNYLKVRGRSVYIVVVLIWQPKRRPRKTRMRVGRFAASVPIELLDSLSMNLQSAEIE